MEHDDSTLGDLESTLKSNARDLVDSLEQGNFGAAVQLINELNKVRDRGLYHEVGKLTRELHNAIVNFQLDPRMPHTQELSQIADATERLNYVVTMTEKAANRTMDLVEQSAPLVNDLSDEAQSLSVEHARVVGFDSLHVKPEIEMKCSKSDQFLPEVLSFFAAFCFFFCFLLLRSRPASFARSKPGFKTTLLLIS